VPAPKPRAAPAAPDAFADGTPDVTDPLLWLLLMVPIALGVPALALTGLLDSGLGLGFGVAVLLAWLHVALSWALRPRQALARRARELAPAGAGGGDWAQIDACLDTLSRQREAGRARIHDLEAELHRALGAAESAAVAKRAFLANIGHELRTPLNVIVGMTRLSLKLAKLPQQREHLLRADRATQGLLTLINNLMDLAKLETGELQLLHCSFAISDLLAQLSAACEDEASGKGLVLRTEVGPGVPPVLTGDPDRLHQVLGNLLDNAIRFTDAGEIVLGCMLVETDLALARVRFEVRDTGIGMPVEEQQTMFELFRQGDTSLARRHAGSGLGLGLCYRLVAAMGGELTLDSKPGVGSSLRFELALGQLNPVPAAKQTTVLTRTSDRGFSGSRGRHPQPAPPPVQRESGLGDPRPGGNGRLLRRLSSRFRLDHRTFVEDYGSLHAAGDRFGAARLARALESAAASLGAPELREAASRLALKRRADDDPTLELQRVSRLLHGLLTAIDRELAAAPRDASRPPPHPGLVNTEDTPAATDGADATRIDDVDPAPVADTVLDAAAAERRRAAVVAAIQQVANLLADFDAAAINAFVPLQAGLSGLVADSRLEALCDAINGFDFATGASLLRGIAAELDIPIKEQG
jgi:signal transduction histidine kinase/HPt (histidine-containing phosphotransfer) domain-containing protein